MTRFHIITNAETGQVSQVAFTPEEEAAADAVRPVLPDLQPYQFFSMLEISGKKTALDAFINALPPPANIVARAKLDRSLVFRRDNDLVLAAQQALGLTDEQLDTLWAQAAAII